MRPEFPGLGFVLRGLALRVSDGPRTPPVPVPAPPGLEPPAPLPDAENGYVALAALVHDWPSEGHAEPDLLHWLRALPGERPAAERALLPLRPLLDRLQPVLAMPSWQVTVPEGRTWPELRPIRRLAQAALLRDALEGRDRDREAALAIARRLRNSQSPMLHFLVGLAIERTAKGAFEAVDAERVETIRWELARIIVPGAHEAGPWEPSREPLPPSWLDDRRAVRWLLADNPLPHDPSALITTLVAERGLLERGTAAEIRERANVLGAAWPPEMRSVLDGGVGNVPLLCLRRARPALRVLPNAYGLLGLARTLNAAAHLAQALEAAKGSTDDR